MMQKFTGTKEELEKLADQIDIETNVDDIIQYNVGGGIHGEPPILTRGEPVQDEKTGVWVYITKDVDPEVIATVIVETNVAVVEVAVIAEG